MERDEYIQEPAEGCGSGVYLAVQEQIPDTILQNPGARFLRWAALARSSNPRATSDLRSAKAGSASPRADKVMVHFKEILCWIGAGIVDEGGWLLVSHWARERLSHRQSGADRQGSAQDGVSAVIGRRWCRAIVADAD